MPRRPLHQHLPLQPSASPILSRPTANLRRLLRLSPRQTDFAVVPRATLVPEPLLAPAAAHTVSVEALPTTVAQAAKTALAHVVLLSSLRLPHQQVLCLLRPCQSTRTPHGLLRLIQCLQVALAFTRMPHPLQ